MSAAEIILSVSTWIALAALVAAFLLTVWRVVKGPTLPDRVVALDMLVGIVIGFIALIAIRTGFTLYIDIAIALGLVGFLATVAFARFILANRSHHDEGKVSPGDGVQNTSPDAPMAQTAGRSSASVSGKAARRAGEPEAPVKKPRSGRGEGPKAAEPAPAVKSASAARKSVAQAGAEQADEKARRKSTGKSAGKPRAKPASKPAKGE